MLSRESDEAMVVVFHRDGTLHLDELQPCRQATFPTGVTHVEDDDKVLEAFASFISGSSLQGASRNFSLQHDWVEVCRTLADYDMASPDYLVFRSPEIMVAFTKNAAVSPAATEVVAGNLLDWKITSWEARRHIPADIHRPKNVKEIQHLVRLALKQKFSLTVIGGGHSGHCLWPGVVAIDMRNFRSLDIVSCKNSGGHGSNSDSLIVVGSGCTTGYIISETMAKGLTVPLGARPSVGSGLWLQGGIGHLARPYGLTCDNIVGVVLVGLKHGQLFCVGNVPDQYWPAGAIRPDGEKELLWALRGAGTNFGIVVYVVFKAHSAPMFSVHNWKIPLRNDMEALSWLSKLNIHASPEMSAHCSADAYLFSDASQLYLGVTTFQVHTVNPLETPKRTSLMNVLGLEHTSQIVDGVGVFNTEMYMSGMLGGHGSGKTNSFKRCLFLRNIGAANVSEILVKALKSRPSLLCYLHLLQGGKAVKDVGADASAFGCRDWDFACVITSVWVRDQDGTGSAQAAIDWVYQVVDELLPVSVGAYGTDLGPDPRDKALALRAFGPNLSRLSILKNKWDPQNVLAHACPLPVVPRQKIIILVTGRSGAGKDYCAAIWASAFAARTQNNITVRVVSVSYKFKQEYAAATGVDLSRLLNDRIYKENHRPAMTKLFQDQLHQRPQMCEEHFLNVVKAAADVQVLLITGMRDAESVTRLSNLVPGSRVIDVRVEVCDIIRNGRGSDVIKDNLDSYVKSATLNY